MSATSELLSDRLEAERTSTNFWAAQLQGTDDPALHASAPPGLEQSTLVFYDLIAGTPTGGKDGQVFSDSQAIGK